MIVVDTTVIIDALRGRDDAIRFFDALEQTPVCSELSRVEVLRGMYEDERAATLEMLDLFDWLPVTESIATLAGELGRTHRKSHGVLHVADLVIAASVIEVDAELATTNVKHFPMFPKLRAAYKMSK